MISLCGAFKYCDINPDEVLGLTRADKTTNIATFYPIMSVKLPLREIIPNEVFFANKLQNTFLHNTTLLLVHGLGYSVTTDTMSSATQPEHKGVEEQNPYTPAIRRTPERNPTPRTQPKAQHRYALTNLYK